MTWRFTGEDLAEESFPSGCCLQHYANTDTSKMQLTIEVAKGAQSWKKKSIWEKCCQMEQKIWLNCMIVTDKLEFNCHTVLNTKFEMPMFFSLNMLEIWVQTIFEAKWAKGIQLYSSHSVACPTLHLAKGQTQWQLSRWLNTFKYIFFWI